MSALSGITPSSSVKFHQSAALDMPSNLWAHIFSFLPSTDIGRAHETCSKLRMVTVLRPLDFTKSIDADTLLRVCALYNIKEVGHVNLDFSSDKDLLQLKDISFTGLDIQGSYNLTLIALAILENMPLKALFINSCNHLNIVPKLKQLETLRASVVTDQDLASFKGLPLKKLVLARSPDITTAGLAHLAELPLEELYLNTNSLWDEFNKNIDDAGLAPLKNLKGLNVLHLENFRRITAQGLITHLVGLPLTDLNTTTMQLTNGDVTGLMTTFPLHNLEMCSVGLTNEVFTTLQQSIHLRSLIVKKGWSEEVSTLNARALRSLAHSSLEHLDLRDVPIQDEDLRCLSDLPQLQSVVLSGYDRGMGPCELYHLWSEVPPEADRAISDKGLDYIKKMKIRHFTLMHSGQLGDAGIASLCALENLETLSLPKGRPRTLLSRASLELLKKHPQLKMIQGKILEQFFDSAHLKDDPTVYKFFGIAPQPQTPVDPMEALRDPRLTQLFGSGRIIVKYSGDQTPSIRGAPINNLDWHVSKPLTRGSEAGTWEFVFTNRLARPARFKIFLDKVSEIESNPVVHAGDTVIHTPKFPLSVASAPKLEKPGKVDQN